MTSEFDLLLLPITFHAKAGKIIFIIMYGIYTNKVESRSSSITVCGTREEG